MAQSRGSVSARILSAFLILGLNLGGQTPFALKGSDPFRFSSLRPQPARSGLEEALSSGLEEDKGLKLEILRDQVLFHVRKRYEGRILKNHFTGFTVGVKGGRRLKIRAPVRNGVLYLYLIPKLKGAGTDEAFDPLQAQADIFNLLRGVSKDSPQWSYPGFWEPLSKKGFTDTVSYRWVFEEETLLKFPSGRRSGPSASGLEEPGVVDLSAVMEKGVRPAVDVYEDPAGRRRIRWESIPADKRDTLSVIRSPERGFQGSVLPFGGFVRALLLGLTPSDLDLIEVKGGRPVEWMASLAERGESVGSFRIDLFPHVRIDLDAGRLENDNFLDFSFNKMMLVFDQEEDPILLDPYKGYEDLFPVSGPRRGRLIADEPRINSAASVGRFLRFVQSGDLALTIGEEEVQAIARMVGNLRAQPDSWQVDMETFGLSRQEIENILTEADSWLNSRPASGLDAEAALGRLEAALQALFNHPNGVTLHWQVLGPSILERYPFLASLELAKYFVIDPGGEGTGAVAQALSKQPNVKRDGRVHYYGGAADVKNFERYAAQYQFSFWPNPLLSANPQPRDLLRQILSNLTGGLSEEVVKQRLRDNTPKGGITLDQLVRDLETLSGA